MRLYSIEDIALAAIKTLLIENALTLHRTGRLVRVLRWSRLGEVVEELSRKHGADVNIFSVLTLCGRILSKYSKPVKRSRPHSFYVTTALLHHLFNIRWEDVRDKPLHQLDPVELYYTVLLPYEWGGWYEDEDTAE
ncbi:MAG: hypothetical protein QXJ56_07010 [Ignisphaera sp.]